MHAPMKIIRTKITTAHSPQSCRRKIQFRQCSETALLLTVLDVVTACARHCGTQSLLDCLCPLMLNAATACTRYSWMQSLPLPFTVEHSYFQAHYCWTQSLPLPVTVERIYFLAHYCWTQSLPVLVTVKSSHCLCPSHYKQSLPVPVTVERSHCLCPLLLNAATACARPVEHSHCLCPLLLNAVTACARYCWMQSLSFLSSFVSGAFAKFPKWLSASSCLSVCIGQLGSHWMDFYEILCG